MDICEREFIFKIDPRGSHTIQYVCEDGHTEPVNCYGYSALKTAWASWKRKFDDAVHRGSGKPFLTSSSVNTPSSSARTTAGQCTMVQFALPSHSMERTSVVCMSALRARSRTRISNARSLASWRLRNTSSDTSSPQNATLALIARSLPWSRSGAIESVQQKTQPSLGNWRGGYFVAYESVRDSAKIHRPYHLNAF